MTGIAWDGEHVALGHDRQTGMRAVIAIDDTTRGPGFGGVRLRPYPSAEAAVSEAQRLARAMTYKHAAAGLPFGGAKAVIVDDGHTGDRDALMLAFGRFVARLGGLYIPGVDMGTTVADLALIGTVAPDVACHDEDPSPWTALGVWAGIHAATAHAGVDVAGARVLVQGAGHVGAELARLLADDGAHVLVADVDADRAAAVARDVRGTVVPPPAVLDAGCDVFAPCATAKVLDEQTAGRVDARIVAGAANDTLATPQTARVLARRGIAYIPDFVLNAGGVIQVQALRAGWSHAELRAAVLGIGERVARILDEARRDDLLPVEVAERMARSALMPAAA